MASELIFSIFCFLLGLCIGSFLNVVVYRYNTGRSVNGRSMCFSCGKKLNWYELIPFFSFLFLKGKCSSCKSKISWQYPIVELITGSIFLALYITGMPTIWLIYYFIIFCLFIAIGVYDLRHMIIPDGLVYLLIFFSLLPEVVMSVLLGSFSPILNIDFFAGPILFVPFWALWYFSNGRWMGFGDAKLVTAIGFILGLTQGVSAIFIGFWLGAIVSCFAMIFQKIKQKNEIHEGLKISEKNLTMSSEIPFAPFLILGFFIVFFFGIDVISF